MKADITQLPATLYERLKKIQEAPTEFAGYYIKSGSKGLAIFGVIVAIIATIITIAIASSGEDVPYFVWLGAMFIIALIFVSSKNYITNFNAAEVKPYVFINPLYFMRIGFEEITYYNLWTDRQDTKITHNYTNGAYTGTSFNFYFKDGKSEFLSVSPKAEADKLIDTINLYRDYIAEALDKKDYDALAGHDILFELFAEKEGEAKQDPLLMEAPPKKSKWAAFGQMCMIAAILGTGVHYYAKYEYQSRRLRWCRSKKRL